uniref:RNA-directed DNA polymerase, eukaryota n=1 Tax=Tanacetum cinerariifolium TaxID=118510 RepID=A0A699HLP2_TANCI|nr:RNA-directed DNA polymerase, eukaryota [Tanacetum cinerariifolium]
MARDLWKACNDYGVVVDAFIPYKKSKSGKTNNVMSDQVLPSLILDDSYISDIDFILSFMVYWVRTKEMEAWDPFICNDSYESESSDDEEDAKDDGSQSGDKVTADNDVERDKVLSVDPFNLYDILNKRKDSGDDLKYPHGFTPSVINVEEVNKKVKGATSNEETKIESMELVTIKTLQGNSSFDYALSSSLGNSRGIFCVWEPTLLVNDNVTSSDNFLAVMASLIDLPLDGYAYTWDYKTANKMSSSNEGILSDRSLLLNELNDINSIDSLEADHKSKVCWAIEGDENTKFFHGILNSKRSQLAIRETLVDGEWIVDPLAVKSVFLKYFSTQLSSPVSNHICFADQFNNRLSSEQQIDLEQNASNEEINSAVWDYGTDNSPGPDGFTFELFRLFSGILIDSSMTLSHISFVDDVIFVDSALNSLSSLSKRSPWLNIIREETVLRIKGINLLDLICKKVGNELNSLFWADPGLDDLVLKHKFSRLYALDKYKQITVVEKINHTSMVDTFFRPPIGGAEEEQLDFLLSRIDGLILTNISDRSVWSLEAIGEFFVRFVRQLIDDSILPKGEVATRWVKVMPIEINVFAWRVRLDKLPTRSNISLKGIDISTIVCPLCHASVESSSHILFSCPMARHL